MFLMNFTLELKNMPFAKFTPASLINVDRSPWHYMVVSCLANTVQGEVLPGVGMFKNSQKNRQVSQQFCNRL